MKSKKDLAKVAANVYKAIQDGEKVIFTVKRKDGTEVKSKLTSIDKATATFFTYFDDKDVEKYTIEIIRETFE